MFCRPVLKTIYSELVNGRKGQMSLAECVVTLWSQRQKDREMRGLKRVRMNESEYTDYWR